MNKLFQKKKKKGFNQICIWAIPLNRLLISECISQFFEKKFNIKNNLKYYHNLNYKIEKILRKTFFLLGTALVIQ
jgi:hypothetical protein